MQKRAREIPPMRPEYLAYSEVDGGLSIEANVVAMRLNVLLELIQDLEARLDAAEEPRPDAHG